MTKLTRSASEADRATEIRHALADKLVADRRITSPAVARAFRIVPRHLFVPDGTPLEVAYNDANSVAIKQDADGVVISSTSAPFIQARMIEQADLGPGMIVLEIGSGGYNAALVAEVVGSSGHVVSVDIDQEVVDMARTRLAATGYGEAHSAEAVRFRIKQMIDDERPSAVLSDDAIVTRLKEGGIDIARRTVAKYRESLRIPSSMERRREKVAMAAADR